MKFLLKNSCRDAEANCWQVVTVDFANNVVLLSVSGLSFLNIDKTESKTSKQSKEIKETDKKLYFHNQLTPINHRT